MGGQASQSRAPAHSKPPFLHSSSPGPRDREGSALGPSRTWPCHHLGLDGANPWGAGDRTDEMHPAGEGRQPQRLGEALWDPQAKALRIRSRPEQLDGSRQTAAPENLQQLHGNLQWLQRQLHLLRTHLPAGWVSPPSIMDLP
ncbi:uncharacterized protein LOC125115274 isoform X2 [Phacochoerus africanus]|uniref:uncharacterized protein LOC125115274 isoform X2 n=1 Tax=Phacochoerus africanus TaxID=41426 RepID=UPI001FD91D41|nr:uncharacterized protein LOC125115274 isoform X2 [Phacochoerus africanus]